MAYQLETLSRLADIWNSVPDIHIRQVIVSCNSSSRGTDMKCTDSKLDAIGIEFWVVQNEGKLLIEYCLAWGHLHQRIRQRIILIGN